jgi:hypothetical protein
MNSPNGWAMLDDMAKNVSEALNKKSITPEDELANALDDMAHDIALLEQNPAGWGGCVTYFLE